MTDIDARLDELRQGGRLRRTRMVSGPQGPHVLVDGRPVLLLCSANYLGLADHPRVREAAADAAIRWGAGAGASRLASGCMTVHRRLEERLAERFAAERCLLFGSGYLANLGAIGALAGPGDVVFSDELNHASIADGCRLSGAEVFVYAHGDLDHLAWALRHANGRGSLVATEGMFGSDGSLAPLPELVELAHRHDARLLVDESHAAGTVGSTGRGAAAAAGVEDAVDLVTGTLGAALGSYGGFVCCDAGVARLLASTAPALMHSHAPPPPAVAGAAAALDLLESQPYRIDKLRRNAAALRAALAGAGRPAAGRADAPIVPLPVAGGGAGAAAASDRALARGVFVEPVHPEATLAGVAQLRLAVMASHTETELRRASGVLAGAAPSPAAHEWTPFAERMRTAEGRARPPLERAVRPGHGAFDGDEAPASADREVSDGERAPAAAARAGVFDGEAAETAPRRVFDADADGSLRAA